MAESPLTVPPLGQGMAALDTPVVPRAPPNLFTTPLSELTQSESGLLTISELIKQALGVERFDALMEWLTPEEKINLGITLPAPAFGGRRSRRRRRSARSKSKKGGRR
jgi:hypothetical protein